MASSRNTGTRRPGGSREPLLFGGKTVNPGDRIDHYVFEREVGSGGMARVLLARDPGGEEVALKVLRASRFETGIVRFRREFHTLSRIKHPNVIRVDAYGDLHGHPYIAMEYVEGPDLHTVIRQFRGWDDDKRYARCEEILIDLCRALSAIHRRGLVHRDLKPSNVLLAADGTCKLTDFGIVKELDPRNNPELSTTLVGTWAYTSPEHITGRPIDHRSDLYSLGVILFALLTGKRPFVAENMAGYLEAHRDKTPPSPTRVRPGVPEHLAAICERLLAKRPRDRFQSAAEILYRLEADDPMTEAEGFDAWEPPLVGQAEAVGSVEDAVAALTDRRGGLVRVLGDDGSGKSRLAKLAVDRARMLGLPYQLLRFHADAPVYASAIKLARGLLAGQAEGAPPELQRIVSAYTEGTPLRGDTRYALYDAIRDALGLELADRPRLLVLEDLHLAPPPDLDLFRYLVRHLIEDGRQPWLVLTTTRRPGALERSPLASADLDVTTVELEPLTAANLRVIVASLLGSTRATERLADRLHAETEGNPYFVVEFLRSLIAQGLIVRGASGWEPTLAPEELAEGHLEIPPSIRQLLQSRLDEVHTKDRAILEILAVAAQEIDLDTLLETLDVDEERLLRRLDRLILAGLVREHRRGEELAYEITHGQVADLVRRESDAERVRLLHGDLARALETLHGHEAQSLARIGHHYLEAGESGEAYDNLVTAARILAESSLVAEAVVLSDEAGTVAVSAQVDLAYDRYMALRLDHLWVQGLAAQNRADWAGAAEHYRERMQLASELDDQRAVADSKLELSRTLRRRGLHDEATAVAEDALRIARRRHDRKLVAEGIHNLAALAWKVGDLDQANALAHEGLMAARGPELALERARLLLTHALTLATTGQLASAVRGLREAADLLSELRMKHPRALALANLAELFVWQGDLDEAERHAEDALQIADGLDYRLGQVVSLRALGMAQLELGRYEGAHEHLHRAADAADAIAMHHEVLACCVHLAQASLEQHDPVGALRHIERGLTAALQQDPERYLPMLQAHAARALALRRPDASAKLLGAVEDAIPTLNLPRALQTRFVLAWAYLARRDADAAVHHAEAIIDEPSARSFRLLHIETRALLAAHTSGETATRHRRAGAELAREYTDSMPIRTGEEVRRRSFFRHLESEL